MLACSCIPSNCVLEARGSEVRAVLGTRANLRPPWNSRDLDSPPSPKKEREKKKKRIKAHLSFYKKHYTRVNKRGRPSKAETHITNRNLNFQHVFLIAVAHLKGFQVDKQPGRVTVSVSM